MPRATRRSERRRQPFSFFVELYSLTVCCFSPEGEPEEPAVDPSSASSPTRPTGGSLSNLSLGSCSCTNREDVSFECLPTASPDDAAIGDGPPTSAAEGESAAHAAPTNAAAKLAGFDKPDVVHEDVDDRPQHAP